MKNSFFAALFFIIPLLGHPQAKILPQNEMYRDSSLTNFVCKLQYAIFKRDKGFLLSVVDQDIKNSFGGSDGIEEFKQMWDLDNPDSPIWFIMSKIISLGGKFSNYQFAETSPDRFVFPYVFALELPNESLDYFTVLAITGSRVNVREKPDLNSKVLGQLTYDLVNADYNKSVEAVKDKRLQNLSYHGGYDWYHITTLDQKLSGYVYWEYAWSPVGYRMFLTKRNGNWTISCLIAGD